MIYQKTCLPSPALRPFVAHYNFVSSDEAASELQLPPILFSGLAFLLEGSLDITSSNGSRYPDIKDWVSPVTTNPVKLSWSGQSSMISIQFWPGKFYEFFGWPQHLFLDDTVLLHETELEKEFTELFDQLHEAPDVKSRCDLLDTFLLQNYPEKKLYRHAISGPVEKILKGQGQISLEGLMEESRYSERHFRRLFRESVGMNPYTFLRIIRFYKAFAIIKKGNFESLTDISYKAGYFDQSHFIRDYKDFWNILPGEVLDSKNQLALQLLEHTPGVGKIN
ncbi:MAG: AraC family transcriptional regulator [Bacteroidetes bacterium]|nr:MAG: AraC family transcriptional regulator [Bacteroidota bacterium]